MSILYCSHRRIWKVEWRKYAGASLKILLMPPIHNPDSIWVFHGEAAQFSGGLFSSRAKAEIWITRHQLTGILTRYPLDTGVYDWAIDQQYFLPRKEYQRSPRFIGRFTSASQEHEHYVNGKREGDSDEFSTETGNNISDQ
ncbi:hypothetical protein GmarT_49620 [Gimesia maris]|uniref:DUF7710 domain-containing protein n=2 Tax=Gimesia maris TaxID=122 RepID=A0ABX5YTZ9_9PLAN|nr:hypothetical protein GmarT_49620 [Gimesia maris]